MHVRVIHASCKRLGAEKVAPSCTEFWSAWLTWFAVDGMAVRCVQQAQHDDIPLHEHRK